MNPKLWLAASALSAFTMAAGCDKAAETSAVDSVPAKASQPKAKAAAKKAPAKAVASAKGECWGVNACKGKGECGGVGHGCAGSNTCKGQGWITLAKADCDTKGGKFKTGGGHH